MALDVKSRIFLKWQIRLFNTHEEGSTDRRFDIDVFVHYQCHFSSKEETSNQGWFSIGKLANRVYW